MYTHKRCKGADMELLEGVANARFGYCDVCENQGTIYWVLGSEREYRVKKGGVQYLGHLDRAELISATVPYSWYGIVSGRNDGIDIFQRRREFDIAAAEKQLKNP